VTSQSILRSSSIVTSACGQYMFLGNMVWYCPQTFYRKKRGWNWKYIIIIHIQIIRYYCPHLSIIFFVLNWKVWDCKYIATWFFIWSSVTWIDTFACCTWFSGSELFSLSVFLIFTRVYYSLVILHVTWFLSKTIFSDRENIADFFFLTNPCALET
jgi:hypothetical protein